MHARALLDRILLPLVTSLREAELEIAISIRQRDMTLPRSWFTEAARHNHWKEARDAFPDRDPVAMPGRHDQAFQLDSGLDGGAVRFGQPETAHVMRRM